MILFLPWRAGPGSIIPDHWGRCVRWAVFHLALAAVTCALLANGQHFLRWLAEQIWPSSFQPPHITMSSEAPATLMLTWLAQSLVAWAVALLTPLAIAVAISLGVPGRHRAAKLGGVKWSLYLAGLNLAVAAVWYASHAVPLWLAVPRTSRVTPELPVMLLAGAYGLWWAAGMATNPYNRVRGFGAFLGFGLLYGILWMIVTRLLFPVDALEALL